jgi:hypothetical protein
VLVVETAANDGALGSLTAGTALSPLASMERLLRRALLTRPRTHVLLLYICAPYIKSRHVRNLGSGSCEGLYANLTRHYAGSLAGSLAGLGKASDAAPGKIPDTSRVSEVSLRAAAPLHVLQHLEWSGGGWLKIHPSSDAHAAVAQLVFAAAHRHRSRRAADRVAGGGGSAAPATALAPPLPAPLYLDAGFEVADAAWGCRTCGWHDCAHLGAPTFNRGFSVQAPWGRLWQGEKGHGVGQLRKFGWVATAAGSLLAFAVPPHSRVLLALLCSYENVGNATGLVAPEGARFDASAAAAVALRLRWADDSSQQCVASVGESGGGPHVVWLHVASERSGSAAGGALFTTAPAAAATATATSRHANQVKLFGVYSQPLGERRTAAPHVRGDGGGGSLHAFRDFA